MVPATRGGSPPSMTTVSPASIPGGCHREVLGDLDRVATGDRRQAQQGGGGLCIGATRATTAPW